MNIKDLSKPLNVNQVEFRVQSINNGGYATILVYKDARADMQRLDDVCGPLGWKREHLNNNANCIVSVWCPDIQQWVSKEDTGTESNAEAKKGLASDSFKRACFNWGIGRELYHYPMISIKLLGTGDNLAKGDYSSEWTKAPKPKSTWNLKLKEWKWFSQFQDGVIIFLNAKDQKGSTRFEWGKFDKELYKQQQQENK